MTRPTVGWTGLPSAPQPRRARRRQRQVEHERVAHQLGERLGPLASARRPARGTGSSRLPTARRAARSMRSPSCGRSAHASTAPAMSRRASAAPGAPPARNASRIRRDATCSRGPKSKPGMLYSGMPFSAACPSRCRVVVSATARSMKGSSCTATIPAVVGSRMKLGLRCWARQRFSMSSPSAPNPMLSQQAADGGDAHVARRMDSYRSPSTSTSSACRDRRGWRRSPRSRPRRRARASSRRTRRRRARAASAGRCARRRAW